MDSFHYLGTKIDSSFPVLPHLSLSARASGSVITGSPPITPAPAEPQKSTCAKSAADQICKHDCRRRQCKEFGGSKICEHDLRRSRCKDGPGVGICPHKHIKKMRRHARTTGDRSQTCEHSRRRSQCKNCLGADICPHERQKIKCKECGGSQICQQMAAGASTSSAWGRVSAPPSASKGGARIVSSVPYMDVTFLPVGDPGSTGLTDTSALQTVRLFEFHR